MGKAEKAVTKTVSKAVSSATKAVSNVVKAPVKTVTSLAKGDIKGVADGLTKTATFGTVGLQGKYAIVNTGILDKVKATDTPVTDIQTDGLLQYVSDLRTRKARRNRASTNNTAGSVNGDANKLSGTTALGV